MCLYTHCLRRVNIYESNNFSNKNKNFSLKLILLLLLVVLPWTVNNSSEDLKAQEITDDLSFYQITLVTTMEILIKNPKVGYQKHFKIRPNHYSSYQCFGTVTGIDRIGNTFFIAVAPMHLLALF